MAKQTQLNRMFLFLLIIFSVSFSASCIENATSIVLSEEGTNILLVLTITILVIGIAYGAGVSLPNTKYVVFAKDEGFHLAVSAFMLAAFSTIVFSSCQFTHAFNSVIFSNLPKSQCYAEGAEMNGITNCFMNRLSNDATRLTEAYVRGHINDLMDSTLAVSIQIPLTTSFTSTAGAYKRITSNQYDTIANMILIPALLSITMQKIILNIISENAIRWLIPAAFVLRIFIPTREFGNMLIALALGFYVVLPFLYTFNLATYESTLGDCNKYAKAVCDTVLDGDCKTDATITCTNQDGFWEVARILPQAFFLPNLTIAIMMTYLSAMNKAMKVIG